MSNHQNENNVGESTTTTVSSSSTPQQPPLQTSIKDLNDNKQLTQDTIASTTTLPPIVSVTTATPSSISTSTITTRKLKMKNTINLSCLQQLDSTVINCQDDQTFEPTIEMMVNDFDDEQTLEEEEALAARESEDPTNELKNLQKESDMPIEELLALYNCAANNKSSASSPTSSTSSLSNNNINNKKSTATEIADNKNVKENVNKNNNQQEINGINNVNNSSSVVEDIDENNDDDNNNNNHNNEEEEQDDGDEEEDDDDDEDEEEDEINDDDDDDSLINEQTNKINSNFNQQSTLIKSTTTTRITPTRQITGGIQTTTQITTGTTTTTTTLSSTTLVTTNVQSTSQLRKLYPETYGNDKRLLRTISRQQSDEEDDGEYSPDEDEFKKTIMVGSEFQAIIPEGFIKYDDVLPYENEDKLIWDPSKLNEYETEDYLQKANMYKQENGIDAIPQGSHLRDDEQALYLLLQCGHSMDEALRRKRINAVPSTEQMSLWSEEECRNFESGIRIYGKDFHTIQHTKVRTRSVGELVQFYYLWKKTERHDVFANKARLDKKKYSLHPGLTDYMDRFLEEQENNNCNNNLNNLQLRDRSSSPGGTAGTGGCGNGGAGGGGVTNLSGISGGNNYNNLNNLTKNNQGTYDNRHHLHLHHNRHYDTNNRNSNKQNCDVVVRGGGGGNGSIGNDCSNNNNLNNNNMTTMNCKNSLLQADIKRNHINYHNNQIKLKSLNNEQKTISIIQTNQMNSKTIDNNNLCLNNRNNDKQQQQHHHPEQQ